MIKVLMLGWEFPPDISGGLGVACEGLATALISTKEVQILFVVPKALHHRSDDNFDLLGANTVEIPTYSQEMKGGISTTTIPSVTTTSTELLTIEKVDAYLTAYESPKETTSLEFLEKWNASITEQKSLNFQTITDEQKQTGTRRYDFDGGYGKHLLREVDRYAEVVMKLALEHNFDIIHAHDWMTFPAAVAVKHATGKPLVIHVHATEFDRAGNTGSPVVYDIERMAVNECDKAIAVSRLTRNMLVNRYNAAYEKIEVVYNGIELKNAALPIHEVSHPLGEQLVTFLGRITFQKGPEYFVDAAEKVLKEFPDCNFVMAGSGDALPAMIKRVISKRMSDKFHFTGFLNRADVVKLLSFTRVYVMPSVSEPFGLTALEAIQAGIPTVVSKQSGVSEVISDVLKVDFWDTDALAQAICGVLRYPVLAETIKHQAFKGAHGVSWEQAADRVLHVYRTLTRAAHHSPSSR